MKKLSDKSWRKSLIKSLIVIFASCSFSAITLAADPAPAVPPGGGTGSTGSTGTKVVQPSIIPEGSIASGQKLYLPHDTSQDSNKNYLQNRLLPGIASAIIGLVGGLSLLFVIISGIQLLTAYANPEAGEKAKKTLTYALAGLIIAGLSYAIVAIVSSIGAGWTPK